MWCTTWSWVPQWDGDCAAANVTDRISTVPESSITTCSTFTCSLLPYIARRQNIYCQNCQICLVGSSLDEPKINEKTSPPVFLCECLCSYASGCVCLCAWHGASLHACSGGCMCDPLAPPSPPDQVQPTASRQCCRCC